MREAGHRADATRRTGRIAFKAVACAGITVLGGSLTLAAAPAMAAQAGASPGKVAAVLGASKIPAEIVILVDISQSMAPDRGGYYLAVKRALPRFLGQLAKQDPQDKVAIVTFGSRDDTQPIYMGGPKGSYTLPAQATSTGTDFGFAFEKALDILGSAPPTIKLGGVLLLSDGNLFAPNDATYGAGNGYFAPGWAKLRARVRDLGIPVTGYGLPLSNDPVKIDNVRQALGEVFVLRDTFSPQLNDLNAELDVAAQQILASRVRHAAQGDSGRGVEVTWTGVPGVDGASPMDLGPGSTDVAVRLTAGTRHVPLTVSHISVTSTGFPAVITGKAATQRVTVTPGQPATVIVHLSWRPVNGGTSFLGGSLPTSGQLILHGLVTSSFTSTLRGDFGDPAFTVGGISRGTSPSMAATIPVHAEVSLWALILPFLVIVLIVAMVRRMRLGGILTLSWPSFGKDFPDEITIRLRRWPRDSWPVDELTQMPGHMHVRGSFLRDEMRVSVKFDGEKRHVVLLPGGGRTMVAGIWVVHSKPGASRATMAPTVTAPLGGLGR